MLLNKKNFASPRINFEYNLWIQIAPLVRKKPLYLYFFCGGAFIAISVASGLVIYYFDDLRAHENLYKAYLGTIFLEMMGTSTFYVASGSFFSMVADPNIGGTYMSLMWSINNLVRVWKFSNLNYV